MSNTTTYFLTNANYEQARADARERAAYQWADPKRWNLWKTYHSEINPDWFDPWYEYEPVGINNGPSTGEGDPAYEMTQNLYYAYCWFKFKGYNKYSFCAMMASSVHESTITGASWEGRHYPYQKLINFDPTYDGAPPTDTLIRNYVPWMTGGSYPAYDNGSPIAWTATWTAPTDPTNYREYSGRTWRKSADGGSFEAFRRFNIKTERQTVSWGARLILPVGYDTGDLAWDYDSPTYTGNGTGYGFCQWTPWTKIPKTLKSGYIHYHLPEFNEANRHWQMNGTLQLMLWELERYINTNDYGGLLPGSYLGQWLNSNPNAGNQENKVPGAAYFIYPYSSNNLDQRSIWYMWTQNINWNQYANGDYLPATETLIDYADQRAQDTGDMTRPMNDSEREWCRRQMALAIYRSAFLQATYKDFNFPIITDYIMKAWDYWDSHPIVGTNGWSVQDIPRPRDIPFCELDKYHSPEPVIAYTMRRRRQHHVRTILL